MVKIARLNDAFSEVFILEAGPGEGQSLQQNKRKRGKGKAKINLKNPKALKRRSLSLLKVLIWLHA